MPETLARAEGEPARTVRPNRFVNGSAEHVEPFYDSGEVSPGAELSNIEVAANGYLSGILVQVDVTSTGNSADVVADEDGPFNALSSVRLADINGGNIFGPVNGYDWYNAVKYGGFAAYNDARNHPSYAQTAESTAGTAGTQSFLMRIPVQINPRDAFGSLPNMNAASTFKLYFSVAQLSAMFATPPNGTVTVRVRASIETWLVPQAVDGSGVPNATTPPGLGTYQRFVKNTFPITAGSNTLRLPNVSNMIRSIMFTFRDGSGDRDSTNFPDSVELRIDGYARDQIRKAEIRHRTHERYGYQVADLDAGTYVWDWTHELDGKPGFETRELWLPTNSATRLELVGNFDGGGSLDVVTNDVVVAGGDYRQAG